MPMSRSSDPTILSADSSSYPLLGEFRGQCGPARPRVLAGESPAWVIVSREPSIEPCGVAGNGRVDA